MNRQPPLLGRLLLAATAAEAEWEFVAGDLEEEFALMSAERGRFAAGRWYLSQAVRSVGPLLVLRMRSGELTGIVLAAGLGVTLPLLLLDRLWSFVYSQIPLKEGLYRAPGFLAVNMLTAWILCACLKLRPVPALLAVAAAVALSAASPSWVYMAVLLAGAPAGSLILSAWRRRS